MHIDAMDGSLTARVGATFGAGDVARLQEAVTALGPISRLTIDFSAVRQCDDASLARLAASLMTTGGSRELMLRGLTDHQWRLLTYLGLEGGRDEEPR